VLIYLTGMSASFGPPIGEPPQLVAGGGWRENELGAAVIVLWLRRHRRLDTNTPSDDADPVSTGPLVIAGGRSGYGAFGCDQRMDAAVVSDSANCT